MHVISACNNLITLCGDYLNNNTPKHLIHSSFVIGSLFNFLPLVIGYHSQCSGNAYPDNNSIYLALSVSATAATIIILENEWDRVSHFLFEINTEIKNYKLPLCTILVILLIDFILINHSVLLTNADSRNGFLLTQDSLLIWSFCLVLSQLGNPIWTGSKSMGISFIFMCLNWVRSWMSITGNIDTNLIMFINTVNALSMYALLVMSSQILHHFWNMSKSDMDLTEYCKSIHACIYVIFLNIYVIGSRLTIFVNSYWNSLNNESYIVFVTYLTTFCILGVTLITNGIARVGAIKIAKVSSILNSNIKDS